MKRHCDISSCGGAVKTLRMRAFTLIEIMVAVTLMSIIVLGLMAMFTQTQRAFRLGMNQTDVLEAGRIATDLIVREMEQISPGFKTNSATPNFFVELPSPRNSGWQLLPGSVPPNGPWRTNVMSDLFFLTRKNQTWTGIGYFVRTDAAVPGSYGPVGTLYRYQTNNTTFQFNFNPHWMWHGFNFARGNGVMTNVTKVLEGVVHFQVRAFDTNGVQIGSRRDLQASNRMTSAEISLYSTNSAFYPTLYNYRMPSNAVPAYVELEIGLLENSAYERYRGMPTPVRQGEYYTNTLPASVHLFRQRIPIRRVDASAYQ